MKAQRYGPATARRGQDEVGYFNFKVGGTCDDASGGPITTGTGCIVGP